MEKINYEKVIKNYFNQDGSLKLLPKKEKKKLIILHYITQKFELNKQYTEQEVNQKLLSIFADFFLIRRCLVDYGFFRRQVDGSSYWINNEREGNFNE